MLPIACKIEGKGVLPGDPYHWGGRNTEHEIIYTYIYIYMSNQQKYCNISLVLLRLGLSEAAQNLHNR